MSRSGASTRDDFAQDIENHPVNRQYGIPIRCLSVQSRHFINDRASEVRPAEGNVDEHAVGQCWKQRLFALRAKELKSGHCEGRPGASGCVTPQVAPG